MKPPGRVLVVGLGGSLGRTSRSLSALQVALEGAAEAGADVDLVDLKAVSIPMYRPDFGDPPPEAVEMARRVYAAQGLIWSSPMYHGTISGAFKNAIDWLQLLSREDPPYLTDKIVGLISTAGGNQGMQAVNTMEFIVRALRGLAIPLVVPVGRSKTAFGSEGEVTDPRVEQQLKKLGAEVARVAGTFARGSRLESECEKARRSVQELAAAGGS